jgi:hypothetical protein
LDIGVIEREKRESEPPAILLFGCSLRRVHARNSARAACWKGTRQRGHMLPASNRHTLPIGPAAVRCRGASSSSPDVGLAEFGVGCPAWDRKERADCVDAAAPWPITIPVGGWKLNIQPPSGLARRHGGVGSSIVEPLSAATLCVSRPKQAAGWQRAQ